MQGSMPQEQDWGNASEPNLPKDRKSGTKPNSKQKEDVSNVTTPKTEATATAEAEAAVIAAATSTTTEEIPTDAIDTEVEQPAANALKPMNLSNEKSKLQRYFKQLYHAIGELSKYRILNAVAFIKISKKVLCLYLKNIVVDLIKESNFGSGYFEDYLLKRLEDVYEEVLVDKDQQTVDHLRTPAAQDELDVSSCLVGVYGGVSVTLLIVCLLLWGGVSEGFWDNHVVKHSWYSLEATSLLCLYLWLWGFDVYYFEKKKFNHPFIMEADPASVMRSRDIFRLAAMVSLFVLVGLLSFIAYDYSLVDWSPSYVCVSWMILWGIGLFFPWQTTLASRKYLLRSWIRQILAPSQPVYFIDFFLADQWTSLFTIIVDLSFTFCYLFKFKPFFFFYLHV
ncbi:hypothetical protein RFI_10898 [Reticulomyxa filosa]|uniref:SPX domain-containing protein n=1 Tax=Reticulomyxa filosa TaxID=46433 RepID=X6NKH1_RETFI|nr:hypothetical protein RFI_10898 [Reticulomyxa filosa]|eukprot:ETO26239.1 hypothetical protein RFI_10898 [Reticulomyxa filosa]